MLRQSLTRSVHNMLEAKVIKGQCERMTFQRETLQSCFSESIPMLIEHVHEVSPFKKFQLEPEFGEYLSMEGDGSLRVYTARDPDRVLCGYAVFVVRPNRHYKSKTFAYQDALYVAPHERGFGHKFLKWCEEQLQQDGVNVVFHYVTERFDFSPILRRAKYRPVETVWAKQLIIDDE